VPRLLGVTKDSVLRYVPSVFSIFVALLLLCNTFLVEPCCMGNVSRLSCAEFMFVMKSRVHVDLSANLS
jgi:hypothetical protein